MKPIVAIVGRPNVGKSTLFNVLAGKEKAIVHDLPGVTRDRNYRDISVSDTSLTLVDTGGFDTGDDDSLLTLVRHQTEAAIEEADAVLFLADGREGLMPGDEEIARILKRSGKPVVYAVNKVEGKDAEEQVSEFYRLGCDAVYTVSARHRIGITELMEAVCSCIPQYSVKGEHEHETVVSIIGRPNVGKSSLINTLLGSSRLLVSDQAGTTRDPVDSVMRYKERSIRFIDTAGIRKKSRIGYELEQYCVMQALRSIMHSELCLLIIDAVQGVTTQDAKLAEQICERRRSCVIVINKWDCLNKDTHTYKRMSDSIRDALPFLDYAPVVAVSAKTGLRVRKILDIIYELEESYGKRVSTGEVNRIIKSIYEHHPPPRGSHNKTKIYYAAQVRTRPPVFKLYTNNKKAFSPQYVRYLEREMRERCGFSGVPVCITVARRQQSRRNAHS